VKIFIGEGIVKVYEMQAAHGELMVLSPIYWLLFNTTPTIFT
jgi:hypothetical protein